MKLYTRRRLINGFNLGMSLLTMLFGLFWLAWILITLFQQGFAALDWQVLTESTPPPGGSGGLANAIVGSAIMTALGIAVGGPIGILAGTYLAEYGRGSKLAQFIRFINDILLSAPSIIVGLFVFGTVVLMMGSFSGLSGGLALGIIALPVVVRTTENMLGLVPVRLREAAAALGAPAWMVIVCICYRAALPGLVTGVLLAIARISGETAPLLFTALNNQFWSTDLNTAMANLPVTIYQFAMSPYDDWRELAWAGALLITMTVLLISIIARVFLRQRGGR
ncbi:phosphate ABC transporter permease PstA [Alkalilimnicola sp. S0819]|uniref:phosphate ABC transporter permease PstA n=1 Tax=Alkalilimnicola sp. S0819 TaxID=2613922 RepID=UPI001261B991|nr:phosphate ABC transporter permease PstA [Alkalilimnicola sp. S0819]KAB7623178.1 phosphate ABC transporter permease PstA [Alkalilimnicola sp. S0819]MPQ17023.1 phosphate ABC transporter permease PstA [Alkalilimnicola sp. S0819]